MGPFEAFTSYAKRDYTTFDMKNNWIGSIKDFGVLTPIYFSNVIAGDTWKMAHNILVKLPPLVAPAFTRIKAVVNSYYVSYASVWKHWNSFFSGKPDDLFLNRGNLAAYQGKFVEPYVDASYISLICKIAKGNVELTFDSSNQTIAVVPFHNISFGETGYDSTTINLYHQTPVWSSAYDGRRVCSLSDLQTAGFDNDWTSAMILNCSVAEARAQGFDDVQSFLLYQCQSCVRTLESLGVPCDLMAHNAINYYVGTKFNLLPFICLSSIWQNFYRHEMYDSPEFDYSEVNGGLIPNSSDLQTGWKLRINGFPVNYQNNNQKLYLDIMDQYDAFTLLTGFAMTSRFGAQRVGTVGTSDGSTTLPAPYNGLLVQKYRCFEKDYFTSASVDPMLGASAVAVPDTIDALRTASKLEEFLERWASARDFYNFMKYNFGTNPESTRYNKPLLLGTEVVPIQIGEQLQTSQSTTGAQGSPLGERAGVGDGYGNGGTANHYFNENGIVVSLLSFVLDSQYMQGLPHEFEHHLQFDYPFADFANLGADSIKLNELYFGNYNSAGLSYAQGTLSVVQHDGATDNTVTGVNLPSPNTELSGSNVWINGFAPQTGTPSGDGIILSAGDDSSSQNPPMLAGVSVINGSLRNSVFGYIARYAKWKCKQDVVAGDMRESFSYWHTFRRFGCQQSISHQFVSYQDAGWISDLNRIFAVVNDNADKFVVDVFNNCSVRRCLPLAPDTTLN